MKQYFLKSLVLLGVLLMLSFGATNAKAATVTFVVRATNGDSTFNFEIASPIATYNQIKVTTLGGSGTSSFTIPGGYAGYDITENTIPIGWMPGPSNPNCISGTAGSSSGTATSTTSITGVPIGTLPTNQNVTCTFYDTTAAGGSTITVAQQFVRNGNITDINNANPPSSYQITTSCSQTPTLIPDKINASPGPCTISENFGPSQGSNYSTTMSCVGGPLPLSPPIALTTVNGNNIKNATVTLIPGDNGTCTFVNTSVSAGNGSGVGGGASTSIVGTATNSGQSQISTLQSTLINRIAQLIAQLQAQQAITTVPPITAPSPTNTSTTASSGTSATTNTFQNIASQVSSTIQLQQFLNANGFPVTTSGPGSTGQETNYFGPATIKALGEFQIAHGLPATSPGLGEFGPWTKTIINQVLQQSSVNASLNTVGQTNTSSIPTRPTTTSQTTPPTSLPPNSVVPTSPTPIAPQSAGSNTVAPVITMISPASVTQNGAGFYATIMGSGFTPGSFVFLNGSLKATTYISSTQLEAAILPTDINATGNYNIIVTNPASGETSNTDTLVVDPSVTASVGASSSSYSSTGSTTTTSTAGSSQSSPTPSPTPAPTPEPIAP